MKKWLYVIILFIIMVNKVDAVTLENVYEIRPTNVCTIKRDTSNNVRAMQGIVFFDHYAVYCGYQSDTAPTVLTLIDLNTCTILDKNNEKVMGHANDITYNSKEDKFYVTSSLQDKKIFGFKIINNKIVQDDEIIHVNFRFAGFDYDEVNNQYYYYSNGTLYLFPKLNSPNSEIKKLGITPMYYSNIDNGKVKFVTQGISYDNNNIYFARTIGETGSAYFNDSYVLVFNSKTGEYKYAMHFPGTYFNGHLEGVSVIGNKIYFGLNVHSSPKNQTILVYEGVKEIEKDYNSIVKKTELIKKDKEITLFENKPFDYSKIKIKLTYNDDSTKSVDLSENNCLLFDFDSTKIGKQVITIAYEKNEFKLEVNVKKIKEVSRELKTINPIEVLEGETINYSDLYILIKYNDNTKKEIKLNSNNSKIIGFDNTKSGKQTIKIKYDNKEYPLDVKVKKIKEVSRELKARNPVKITKGDQIDYSNFYILIKYNNNTQKQIKIDSKNSTILNFDNNKIGKQVIKIEYDNKEYDYTIIVNEKSESNENETKISKKEELIKSNYFYVITTIIILIVVIVFAVNKKKR